MFSEILIGKDKVGGLGMYARVILKWIFKKQVLWICTGLISAEHWDKSRAFVYTVMNLRVSSMPLISRLVERPLAG
jgi:hypothetical protein